MFNPFRYLPRPIVYAMIKAQMSKSVPFARHAGVELQEIGDGTCRATLDQTESSVNHIGSQHAGALFTLGEAASGGAMAGALAPVILTVRPLASDARITYSRVAKGTITAHATTSRPGKDLLAEISDAGRTTFAVKVTLRDESDAEVATMTVDWSVRKI